MSAEQEKTKEEQKTGFWRRLLRICLKSPVNILLALAILYYAAQVYVLGINPVYNKMIMFGLMGLWLLWLLARSLFKLILLLIVAGGLAYGWYWYSTREIRACEEAGRVWNKEKNVCEDKKTILQKAEELLKKYFPTLMKDTE